MIASGRWRSLDLPHVGWWSTVPAEHVDVPGEADGILGVGGGSAIDTAKHASAEAELPVVHVPTTYSGAEWTTHYGIRSARPAHPRRRRGRASRSALVYDVDLTLELPLDVTVGNGAERARALRRGALRAAAGARRATSRRSPARR